MPAALCTPGSVAMRPSASSKNADRIARFADSARRAGRHARGEHALGAKARIDVLQPDEAANQQAGAGQQHERQRHFDDDQRAQRAPRPRAGAVAAAFAQRVVGAGGCQQRRDQSEQHTGRERGEQREADHRQIERTPDRAAAPECDWPPAPADRDETATASARPATPPASDSIRLSVSIWRSSRPRSAPSAVRSPSSRCRTVLRASSRFATLTQAISSTRTTAPERTMSAGLIGLDRERVNRQDDDRPPRIQPRRLLLALRRDAWPCRPTACVSVTPSRSRATACEMPRPMRRAQPLRRPAVGDVEVGALAFDGEPAAP